MANGILSGVFFWILRVLCALILLPCVYFLTLFFDIIKFLLTFNPFANNLIVSYYYLFVFSFIVLFVAYFIVKVFIYKINDDDKFNKINESTFLKNILIIIVVVGLIPILYDFMYKLVNGLIVTIPSMFNQHELSYRNLLCTIGEVPSDVCEHIFPNNLAKIGENFTPFEYNKVVYFEDKPIILVFITIISFTLIKNFMGIIFQIVERILGLLLQIIVILPYAIAKIIENDFSKFSQILSISVATISLNFIQMFFIYFAFLFPTLIDYKTITFFDNTVKTLGIPVAQMLITAASLFAITNAPGKLQQLIGADFNSTQNSQQVGGIMKGAAGVGATALAGAGLASTFGLKHKEDIANGLKGGVGGLFNGVVDGVKGFKQNPIGSIKNGINNGINSSVNGLEKLKEKGMSVGSSVKDNIKDFSNKEFKEQAGIIGNAALSGVGKVLGPAANLTSMISKGLLQQNGMLGNTTAGKAYQLFNSVSTNSLNALNNQKQD